jgi:hypothetical protein
VVLPQVYNKALSKHLSTVVRSSCSRISIISIGSIVHLICSSRFLVQRKEVSKAGLELNVYLSELKVETIVRLSLDRAQGMESEALASASNYLLTLDMLETAGNGLPTPLSLQTRIPVLGHSLRQSCFRPYQKGTMSAHAALPFARIQAAGNDSPRNCTPSI